MASGSNAMPADGGERPAKGGAASAGEPADAPQALTPAEPGPVPQRTDAASAGPAPTPVVKLILAAYEHPWTVRFTHWLNAVTLFVLVASGLRIFRAFPSFGPKIPQKDLLVVPQSLTLGGWLGGALQWHFTFMWIFAASGLLYLAYQLASGRYRTVLFTPRDAPGLWPMVRHYFLFAPKPALNEPYNPLQKLAYTTTILCGIVSVLTGAVLYKPAQLSSLAWLMGGFAWVRVGHFAAMCGFLAFIPGHLIMVALHGWNNFFAMISGWKKDPEYLR